MSEMVLRLCQKMTDVQVADLKAAAARQGLLGQIPKRMLRPYDEADETSKETMQLLARACLEELRVPTGAMLEAGAIAMAKLDGCYEEGFAVDERYFERASLAFPAMIDAALV